MRILIATDAWHPQINGVVRSIEALVREACRLGAHVDLLTPEGFRTISMPTYPGIRLAMVTARSAAARIVAADVDHVHIATEGPIGLATRRACIRAGRLFTTSYHTSFPDYLAARVPVPRSLSYAWLRWFHNAGAGVMVSTPSVARELKHRGFGRVMRWSRGVDHEMFRPRPDSVLDLPHPIFLYVGRIAVEKNLEAFLSLTLPGSKVLAGEGPARVALEARFPDAVFVGVHTGEALARIYASADVFVFPSRTDTFGIVLLEALASGLPVAAFPVQGPRDVIGDSAAGVLSEDLGLACRKALTVPPETARAFSMNFTWAASARQFFNNVLDVRGLASLPPG